MTTRRLPTLPLAKATQEVASDDADSTLRTLMDLATCVNCRGAMMNDAIFHLQERLFIYRRVLSYQLYQQALLGIHLPPYIKIEIEDTRDYIRQIKMHLRHNGCVVDDLPDDEPG